MHTRTLLHCGLAAALCWTAGDILLVGFVQEPQRYPLFSHTLAAHLGSRTDMAVLMLSGSPQRLFWGVIPATFSIVFYLAAAFGVYRLMHSGRTAKICFALLAAGYALSPLGHAGFYYLGISAQTILAAPPEAHPLLLEQFHRFYTMLDVHWTTAVGLLAFGWLLFLVQTLRGQTRPPAPHGASTLCLQALSSPYHVHCFPNQRLQLPSAVRLSIWHNYSFMPVPHTIKATGKQTEIVKKAV